MAAQSGEEQKAGATGLKASGAEGEFGTRFLVDRAQVFQHNAWDQVQPSEAFFESARTILDQQAQNPVPESELALYHDVPAQYWDDFYSCHTNKFFKDRNWLSKEVPELFLSAEGLPTPDDQLVALPLAEVTQREEAAARDARQEQIQRLQRQHHPRHRKAIQDLFPIAERLTRQALSRGTAAVAWPGNRAQFSAHARRRILEVGCGVGNTARPIVHFNPDPNVFVYACDYAPSAIDVLRTSQWYDPKRCHAFVADLASAQELDLPDNSIDVATAVFVLSALTLAEMKTAVASLFRVLRPGGMLYFRDYGHLDMAQLRLKKGRLLERNFYIRGDGTRVYFYTCEEVEALVQRHGFMVQQLAYDQRLLVNRKNRQEMQRVWVHGKFIKPESS